MIFIFIQIFRMRFHDFHSDSVFKSILEQITIRFGFIEKCFVKNNFISILLLMVSSQNKITIYTANFIQYSAFITHTHTYT
jgi:hypothetical protein